MAVGIVVLVGNGQTNAPPFVMVEPPICATETTTVGLTGRFELLIHKASVEAEAVPCN